MSRKALMRQRAVALLALAVIGGWAADTRADDALNWAEKMFSERTHDFGVVAVGAETRYRLAIKNIYKETVHISNVRTTCGCTAAKPSRETLNSLETAYIEIEMNTLRFKHRKDSNVIVTFDAPLSAEVRIPITVYIRTDVVLNPGGVNFGAVAQGEKAERKISVAYAGRDDWKITSVRTNSKHLAARVVETSRQDGQVGYNLLVSLKATAPVGKLNQQMTLVTDDANNPYIPVLVRGTVEADITVTPPVIALGTVQPGDRKTTNVVIRGRKPFVIKTIESDSNRKAFTVRLSKSARKVHVLPLAFTAPMKPGPFTEVFTVTIAGRPQPVTFKAYGTIAK